MTLEPTLREKILTKLVEVIDPETGVDVLHMRLIEELVVDEESGQVSYRFRPSSPLCPLAFSLARDIKQAISSIPGVQAQQIEVVNYIHAEELTELINQSDV
ncbi:MAG: iron-sulfur cluster assembly protein [Anaerolineae bacterium]|nr:iron-sulfur cluster assembly protein [Anaerolineae bacterium]